MRPMEYRVSLMLVALGLTACITRADIEDINKNQKEMLSKIDKMQKAPTARKAAVGRPDPSKVYSFAAGDSPAKGPKDAWVTIIEVSDFQ